MTGDAEVRVALDFDPIERALLEQVAAACGDLKSILERIDMLEKRIDRLEKRFDISKST